MGNYHVRFLGEGAAAMPLPYPTTRRARYASSERRAEGRSSCTEAVAEWTCKQEICKLPNLPYISRSLVQWW
jgi:hypothetical protein